MRRDSGQTGKRRRGGVVGENREVWEKAQVADGER